MPPPLNLELGFRSHTAEPWIGYQVQPIGVGFYGFHFAIPFSPIARESNPVVPGEVFMLACRIDGVGSAEAGFIMISTPFSSPQPRRPFVIPAIFTILAAPCHQ